MGKYVSRAGLKLESVVSELGLDFKDKTVLDVGSSTGGFTDYALQHGAKKVIAVDLGTDQLHSSLRANSKVELHEKTDIREFSTDETIELILIDVSFISLKDVLPRIISLSSKSTQIVAMVKPQFEAKPSQLNKGVLKNETIRRKILKDFESWIRKYFIVEAKQDSKIAGSKGNRERFYLLLKLQ